MPIHAKGIAAALAAAALLPPAPPANASPTPAAPVTQPVIGIPGRTEVAYRTWRRDVQEVADRAHTYVAARTQHAAPGERLAIVLDVDNTALETGFAEVLPIPPVEAVLHVALAARAQAVKIFFVTARPTIMDPVTEGNLRYAGYPVDGLFSRPTQDTLGNPGDFKTAKRKEIEQQGYTIIANIGNTATDLAGGRAERTFKLPDYGGQLW
ncbi:HAD family acid phosphatase [Streptomyces sp. NPDC055709]